MLPKDLMEYLESGDHTLEDLLTSKKSATETSLTNALGQMQNAHFQRASQYVSSLGFYGTQIGTWR